MHTADFETKAISPTGPVLPKPVGLSIQGPDGTGRYYAWGHPEGNNCTEEEAKDALADIWDQPIITHNGCGFDFPVAEHWWGLPPRPAETSHDTLFLAYLNNPHAASLHLKDLAYTQCGVPPDEQRDLYDWIVRNVPAC